MNSYRYIRQQGLIGAILWLALALRTYKITSVPSVVDEAATLGKYVRMSLFDIFTTIHSNNHPLASALAHLFSPQADNLFLMRWPMILLGMVSLPFVYRLGREMFGYKVGILALFLVAVSPLHFGYSVIVRGYIGLMCLTTLSHYFLWRAWRYNHWRAWLLFVVSNIAIIYFHLFSGALALVMQLGLFGLGALWPYLQQSKPHRSQRPVRFMFRNLAIATLLLLTVHVPMIYLRTKYVLAEGGWSNDFEVWRDGVFSWSEDSYPIITFIRLMALVSPVGWVAYLYLFFLIIGLAHLGRKNRLLVAIWFIAPFIMIWVALQILSENFYAYVRFLIYLLPSYLILVALGMVRTLSFISSRMTTDKQQMTNRLIMASSGVGLLLLVAFSTQGYIGASTHSDWAALAHRLAAELQPQDIVICEEGQGFDIPDRSKAHCIWALNLLLPNLVAHQVQSSPDFVANYNNLLAQRTLMVKPGRIWLVMWQKISFSPEHFLAKHLPVIEPPVPPAHFAPYLADNFGSATLVKVDSADTLLGNLYQTEQLLVQVESSAADQARHYRNLAEIEAIQGHKDTAQGFYNQSWQSVERAGHMYPELFLHDTKPLIDRLPAIGSESGETIKLGYRFGASLCLQTLSVPTTSIRIGQPFTLTLHWHTLDFITEDYGYFIQLDTPQKQTLMRLDFQPFDRVYPTTWWWTQQPLAEQRTFMLPPDLPTGNYLVQLGVYDNQQPQQPQTAPLFWVKYQPTSAQWRIEPINSGQSSLVNCH